MERFTYEIVVEGTVQGVGFRPFVYALAKRYGLNGVILNNAKGVKITINATSDLLQAFLLSLQKELPPLASVDRLVYSQTTLREFSDFQIVASDEAGVRTARIPPDVSICEACEVELFDPANRRYLYPFITCTHCGVRYSIIYALPYDRRYTSMKFFKMCSACEKEYNDPMNRRYHAQPIGCWECGPKLTLYDNVGVPLVGTLDKTVELLREGNIVAVKGVGGYHLMCDATNDNAVERLRQRKHRPDKPFAVMVRDIEMARRYAEVSEREAMMLRSKERPIVLLQSKGNHEGLPLQIAPNISRIGLFLPYTPLHLLLMHSLNRPLVATSANLSDEPLCTTLESLRTLEGVYDYILDHDRSIVNGCDDSVLTVVEGQILMLRRARGYAPASIKLPAKLQYNTLALGANQKNTIAIGFEDQVILSVHIGDLDTIGSVEYYRQNIEALKRIYDFTPQRIAHDKHPNYESSKVALSLQNDTVSLIGVQHHYAHILGVMAEKGMSGKVLGVAFDGTGYGDDGTLWGGEFLVCDYEGYERVAHLQTFRLLGGAKAIKEPRRVALSLLFDLYGKEAIKLDNPTIKAFEPSELEGHFVAWNKGLNAPLSSSVGRLFDAVSSLLGVCHVMSYEGQSGMLLEELYDSNVRGEYAFEIKEGQIDILPMLQQMLQEQKVGVAVSRFFHTLVKMIETLHQRYNLPLVLSGGVFQNRVLLALVLKKIPTAIIPNTIPPNDGGIALGQVAYRG